MVQYGLTGLVPIGFSCFHSLLSSGQVWCKAVHFSIQWRWYWWPQRPVAIGQASVSPFTSHSAHGWTNGNLQMEQHGSSLLVLVPVYFSCSHSSSYGQVWCKGVHFSIQWRWYWWPQLPVAMGQASVSPFTSHSAHGWTNEFLQMGQNSSSSLVPVCFSCSHSLLSYGQVWCKAAHFSIQWRW